MQASATSATTLNAPSIPLCVPPGLLRTPAQVWQQRTHTHTEKNVVECMSWPRWKLEARTLLFFGLSAPKINALRPSCIMPEPPSACSDSLLIFGRNGMDWAASGWDADVLDDVRARGSIVSAQTACGRTCRGRIACCDEVQLER